MIPGLTAKQLLYLNLLLDTICWTILLPALPGIQTQLGISTISMGSISSLFSTVTFITGTVLGNLADSIGRFKMLRASLAVQLAGHLLILLALCFGSPLLFVLSRCVHASCKCAMVVSQAILHDISPLGQNLKDLGTLLAFSNIAFVIGPTVGGYLFALSPFLPSQLSAFIAVCGILLLYSTQWKLREEYRYDETLSHSSAGIACGLGASSQDEESNDVEANAAASSSASSSSSSSQETKSLTHFLHIKFAFQIGNSLFEALMPLHAQQQLGLSSTTIGAVLSWGGALSVFTNLFVLRRLGDFGPHLEDLLPVLAICMGVGLTLWALSSHVILLVLAASIITLSANVFLGVLQTLLGQILRNADSSQGSRSQHRVHSEGDLRVLQLSASSAAHPAPSLWTSLASIRPPSPTSIASSSSSTSSTSASVFGLSSTADRAARILSPLLGSVLWEQFGVMGLVALAMGVSAYCLLLLRGPATPAMPPAVEKLVAAVVHSVQTKLVAWRFVRIKKTE